MKRNLSFTFAVITAIICGVISCTNEFEDFYSEKNISRAASQEYIEIKPNMPSHIVRQNFSIAVKRISDNIKIVNGKASLSHTDATDLLIEEKLFELVKYMYENIDDPYDVLITESRTMTLADGEYQDGDYDNTVNKAVIYNIARLFLDSEFEEKCFDNYWFAMGDMVLTDNDWQGIKQHAESEYASSSTDSNTNLKKVTINFYNNPEYNYALGNSSVYFEGNTAVGFKDPYDFNSIEENSREVLAELGTRIVGSFGNIYGAKPYTITYGKYQE